MMYQDREGKKHFFPDVQSWLTNHDSSKMLSMLKNENFSDLVDSDGTTLLHLSAQYHNKYFVDYLISENLDINAVDCYGETPLMSAIKSHMHTEVWTALLDAGADLWMIKNHSGQSALAILLQKYRSYYFLGVIMIEIQSRCSNTVEIVDALLSAGFQLYHLDIFRNAEITKKMLERGCSVNLRDPENGKHNTALHVAARMGDTENVKVLLQYGADKHIENIDGCLPIVTAFYYDRTPRKELIKLLWPDNKDWIKKGDIMDIMFLRCSKEYLEFLVEQCDADLNMTDFNGRSGLYHLLYNTDLRVWKFLKNIKLNVNAIDNDGKSLLHHAINLNNIEAARFFLEAGANVNVLDKMGRSPLFFITMSISPFITKSQDCVELLMMHGANIQLVDQNGKTVISHLMHDQDKPLFVPILSHLAIIEACDSTLNPVILSEIKANSITEMIFKNYERELNDMKTKTISGIVTYFKFLTDKDKKISRYIQNEEIVKELSKSKGTGYFHRLLMQRFRKAMEIDRWRKNAGQLVIECIKPLDSYCSIIEQILDFLDIADLKLIAGIDSFIK